MESFEHQGVWWLPEAPKKTYHGTLSFDPVNGGLLELALYGPHEFFGKDESSKIDIIHGLVQGSGFTLRGCHFRSGSHNTRGFDEIKMLVDYIYEGRHFDKIEDIMFEELSASYTHLNNWMSDYSFNIFKLERGESIHDVNVSYNPFAPFSISLNDNLDIRFHYHNTGSSSITGVSLENEARITMTPKEKLHFNEYYPFLDFHLPTFLTLATGQTNYPFSITGKVSDNHRPVSIYYKILGYVDNPRSISYMKMLFSFKDVEENLSTYLPNWINKSEELWAVYDEYFKFYHQKYIDPKPQFLSFARALEAYHRNLYDGVYLTLEEYEPIKQALIDAIPDDIEESHKGKLKAMMKSGYEFSLRKRLKTICNEILGEYKEIIKELLGDPNDFVDKVTDTRNYLTHNPKERPKNVIPDEKLYYYILKMQFLLRICFLVEMEFPPDEIKRLVNNNRDYEFLIE